MVDAAAIVLTKPGAEIEHIIRSLKVVLKDLELRRDMGEGGSLAEYEKTPVVEGTKPKRPERVEGTEPTVQTPRPRHSITPRKGSDAK